jgi:hypothetical protein
MKGFIALKCPETKSLTVPLSGPIAVCTSRKFASTRLLTEVGNGGEIEGEHLEDA